MGPREKDFNKQRARRSHFVLELRFSLKLIKVPLSELSAQPCGLTNIKLIAGKQRDFFWLLHCRVTQNFVASKQHQESKQKAFSSITATRDRSCLLLDFIPLFGFRASCVNIEEEKSF